MNHIALNLRDIYFNKRTGRLIYKRAEVQKYFFFQKGTLIQVKTNVTDERLGDILYKLERISKDAHSTLDEFVEPNQNIGEVLRSRGVVSEQDLSDALTYQLRETTLNVFPYFDAEIAFQERDDFAAAGEESKISVPFIIEYGIRRMQPHPALKSFFGGQVPCLKRKSFAYLLTLDEKDILDRITGTDTAEAILRTLTSPPDFFWKSLYLFYCLDLIDLTKGEEARAPGPAAAGLQDKAAEESSAISEVLAFRETMAKKNFYQLLDVARTASEEDIKKAYFQMARRFHPDRFDRKTVSAFKGPIDEVFDGITNAYRVLSNKEKRTAYDSGISTGGGQEEVQDSAKKAEIKFRQGKTLYGMDRFDEAVAFLEEAVRFRRDKADYFLLLAMAESRIPSYLRKAETDYLKAISLEPWNPEAYVGLGVLYKAEGLQMKAVRQFEKALEADPEHAKARQELEDLGLGGKGKKKGLQGLFSLDFLGGKDKKKKK